MNVGNNYELSKEERNEFINTVILADFPEESRDSTKVTIDRIMENYQGLDAAAMSLLGYAAQAKKFDEYVQKLEKHYEDNLQFVHPEARIVAAIPGAQRANRFFYQCFSELGIEVPK